MAMLLITHDIGVIAGRADRVRHVRGADRRARGLARLFYGTRHPYTEALLTSIPKLDQDTRTGCTRSPASRRT